MKTLLIASLCSVTLALTSFGQPPPATSPAKPPGAPPTTATSPATAPVTAPATAPVTAPVTTPAVPAVPGATMTPAAMATASVPGMSPATTTTTTTAASPAATGSPTPAATPESEFDKNFFIHNFKAGGPIMWPILLVSITALAVVLERIFWWLGRWMRRDPKKIEKVFTAIEVGDVAEASRLSRDSRDPVLRMMWNGLNHQHASLQGALQVAAGIEIKRAGRFLVVMDTLVTLAPLLGLLGTIVGLMRAFGSLGNEEIAIVSVTGGIAEALIATACGLGIAIFALIPFNFFTSRVSNLEFELQTAATNLEVMLEAQNKNTHTHSEVEIPGTTPSSATRSSI
ncbi:MAG TPA: MotA/TolQ/ExbB proton channel family protein [Chthoniobacterales bacterium]|nr:MotA/TolQ/ExbB proton channel family protein [Chthoniobacterales bacterium]